MHWGGYSNSGRLDLHLCTASRGYPHSTKQQKPTYTVLVYIRPAGWISNHRWLVYIAGFTVPTMSGQHLMIKLTAWSILKSDIEYISQVPDVRREQINASAVITQHWWQLTLAPHNWTINCASMEFLPASFLSSPPFPFHLLAEPMHLAVSEHYIISVLPRDVQVCACTNQIPLCTPTCTNLASCSITERACMSMYCHTYLL